jgi:RNA polymerase sigma factor (sigma-70 family)
MPENAIPALRDFLVQRYDDLKLRLTRHFGSAEMAGDALHDVWLRLESRDVSGVQDIGAYLMRMAINIAIDRQRSNGLLLNAEELDALVELPDPTPGPAQLTEARSELAVLVAAMEKLPLRRQKILVMVRWEGLTQREVAERLGLSLRTIEKELRKAHEHCVRHAGKPSGRPSK